MNENATNTPSQDSGHANEIDDSEILLGLRNPYGSPLYQDPEIQNLLLQTPEQLPDLPLHDGRQKLIWDFEFIADGSAWNVIRAANVTLWKQPAFYGGYDEFARLSKIILARYGQAVSDLKPTKSSEQYLKGDGFSADRTIEQARRALGFKKLP